MLVLGIETTCDETSASIVEDGKKVYSNVVSSQIKEHLPWAGVVPEIASRLHLKKITIVVEKAIKDASIRKNDIDLIAVANRPGLIGGLAVGVAFAKSFSFGLNKPFIAVNHVEAHLCSPHITNKIEFPYIGLLVSGGHTLITIGKSYTNYEIIGTTIDDAVGEAFDKIAKHYGFGYPGGPAIEKLARDGDKNAFNFPISNLYKSNRKYDVSYSGIKTAVINYLEKYKKKENWTINDIAASFQKRAFDILIKKAELASKDYNIDRIVVAGGVAANQYLREMFSKLKNKKVYFPEIKYATDNGAMIASFGYYKFKEQGASSLNIGVFPRVQGYKISLEEDYRCL